MKLRHRLGLPSVTLWLDQLKAGESAAAGQLWQRYVERLIRLATCKLGDLSKRVADEEDVREETGSQDSPDPQLLDLMQQKFGDYFEAKAWLQEQGITFCSEFDSRA